MIITYLKKSDEIGQVIGIYQGIVVIPEDALRVELEGNEMPLLQNIPSMKPHLMINLESMSLYYDYLSDATIESRLTKTEQETTATQLAIAELAAQLVGGATNG